MSEKHLTAFLISFSLLFTAHYVLAPTWQPNEPRSHSLRMIMNYAIGTSGIGVALLYLQPELWLDLAVCVAGAGFATVLAHATDWLHQLVKRDRANGLIEGAKDQA